MTLSKLTTTIIVFVAALAFAGSASAEVRSGSTQSPQTPASDFEGISQVYNDVQQVDASFDSSTGQVAITFTYWPGTLRLTLPEDGAPLTFAVDYRFQFDNPAEWGTAGTKFRLYRDGESSLKCVAPYLSSVPRPGCSIEQDTDQITMRARVAQPGYVADYQHVSFTDSGSGVDRFFDSFYFDGFTPPAPVHNDPPSAPAVQTQSVEDSKPPQQVIVVQSPDVIVQPAVVNVYVTLTAADAEQAAATAFSKQYASFRAASSRSVTNYRALGRTKRVVIGKWRYKGRNYRRVATITRIDGKHFKAKITKTTRGLR